MAILTAAFELTRDTGFQNLTVEGIAAQAGVGKQTVYRWWPTKADVLLEALAVKADLHVSVVDRGSYRTELTEFLCGSFALLAFPGVTQALRSLMAEAQLDPDFAKRFREGFLERRRTALAEILDRAQARGDHPDRIPAETITDVMFGTIWYRILATDRPLGDTDVDALRNLLNPPPTALDTRTLISQPPKGTAHA